jgi:DNA-binding FadR family transcriptional regulator
VTAEQDVQLEQPSMRLEGKAHRAFGSTPHAPAPASKYGLRTRGDAALADGSASWADPVRICVADKLAQAIQFGILQAGDLLPGERELAEAFGVSRQTIRAALGRLQSRLMLAVCHGRRSRVLGPGTLDVIERAKVLRQLTNRTLGHVQQVRAAVDAEIVRCAVVEIDARTLQRLERLVELQQRMEREPACYHLLDMEFHFTIYRTCANPLMMDIAVDLYAQGIDHRRRVLTREGAVAASVEQHRRVVAAFAARDPEAAVAAMQDHLDTIAAHGSEEIGQEAEEAVPHVQHVPAATERSRNSASGRQRPAERSPEIHDIMRGWARA